MSTKRKPPAKVVLPTVKPSAAKPFKLVINESVVAVETSHAGISSKNEPIEISSDSESESDADNASDVEVGDQDSPESDDEPGRHLGSKIHSQANGNTDAEQLPTPNQSVPADADAGDSDADAEPAFGELIQGQETIDVQAYLSQLPDGAAQLQPSSRTATASALAPPSLSSLSTVLAQALRTDDTDLLESCLHTTDLTTIQNTIERLDSGLVGVLLTKLASRLHRRPGRAGTLMTWIQWSLVAHGGALAAQPGVIERLEALQKVLSERARGLNSLLVLKGKLDLLEAQMQLRRGAHRRHGRHGDEGEDEEADLIWVEGEDEEQDLQDSRAAGTAVKRKAAEVDEDDEGMLPITNGIVGDSDDEEDEENDSESEESEDADDDDDEVDYEDADDVMGEEDEDSDVEEAAPPAKVQKVGSSFSRRR